MPNAPIAAATGAALFIALGVAAPVYMSRSMMQTGLHTVLNEMCNDSGLPGEQQYRVTYTRVKGLDDFLCGPVGFFESSMHPTSTPSLFYFTWTHLALVLIPMIEAKRPGARFPVTFPMVFWTAYQFISMGIGMPWYWLAFVIVQFVSTRAKHKKRTISGLDAESIVVGLVIGDILPFAAMLYFDKLWTTAVWQFFPVLVAIVQGVYVRVRKALSARVRDEDGLKLLKQLHLLVGVIAAIAHWKFILQFGLSELLSLSSDSAGLRETVDVYLKWDCVFGYGATVLGTMWFAESLMETVQLGLWNIVGSIVVGPGAALAGTCIWRT